MRNVAVAIGIAFTIASLIPGVIVRRSDAATTGISQLRSENSKVARAKRKIARQRKKAAVAKALKSQESQVKQKKKPVATPLYPYARKQTVPTSQPSESIPSASNQPDVSFSILFETYKSHDEGWRGLLKIAQESDPTTRKKMLEILESYNEYITRFGDYVEIAQEKSLTDAEMQQATSILETINVLLERFNLAQRMGKLFPDFAANDAYCDSNAHWNSLQNSCACDEGFKPSEDGRYCIVDHDWYERQHNVLQQESDYTRQREADEQELVCQQARRYTGKLGVTHDGNAMAWLRRLGCKK